MTGVEDAGVSWALDGRLAAAAIDWGTLNSPALTFSSHGARWELNSAQLFDIYRSPYLASKYPSHGQSFTLAHLREGITSIRQGNLAVRLEPGDVALLPDFIALDLSASTPTHVTCVCLPAGTLHTRTAPRISVLDDELLLTRPTKLFIETLVSYLRAPGMDHSIYPDPIGKTLTDIIVGLITESQES